MLRLAGLKASDVDLVAVDTVNNYLFDGLRSFDGWFRSDKGLIRDTVFAAVSALGPWVQSIPLLETAYYKLRWPMFASRRRRIGAILRNEFDIQAPVRFVDHPPRARDVSLLYKRVQECDGRHDGRRR